MSFIDEINEIKNERKEREDLVITEILNYFKIKLDSVAYEEYLKKRIKSKITESENTLTLRVEFWEYSSGCSATNFKCGGCEFKLEYKEYDYKGIRLRDIQYKVGELLSELLINKLKELGLQVIGTTRRDNEFRYKYYKNDIEIGW